MPNQDTQRALAEQKLIASAWALAQAQSASRILIASAHAGAGKTTFAACLTRRVRWLTSTPVHIVSAHANLPELTDKASAASVWVDGASVLDGDLLALSVELRMQLQGAIVIAQGHCTTRTELHEVGLQLKAAGIPPLGCIWNSFVAPVPQSRRPLSRLRARLQRNIAPEAP